MKNPDSNDLKLGTMVVLDTVLEPIDFEFKSLRVRGTFPTVDSDILSFKIHFSFCFYKFSKQSFFSILLQSCPIQLFQFYKLCKQSFLYLFYYSFVKYNHLRLYVFFMQ